MTYFDSAIKAFAEKDPSSCFTLSFLVGLDSELRKLGQNSQTGELTRTITFSDKEYRSIPINRTPRDQGPHDDAAILSSKQDSFLIRSISNLTVQCSRLLVKIGQTTGLPLGYTMDIFNAVTGPPGRRSVQIPENIQMSAIAEAHKGIYALIKESIMVLMMAGLAEIMKISEYRRSEQALDRIKNFLSERACCKAMEQRAFNIVTAEDLDKYITEEYSDFVYIQPAFRAYAEQVIKNFVKSKSSLLQPMGDFTPPSYRLRDDLRRALPSIDSEIIDDPEQDDPGELQTCEEYDFASHIRDKIMSKMASNLLDSYELTGYLENAIAYLKKTIESSGSNILESYRVKEPNLGKSFRTARRITRELKNGKLNDLIQEGGDDPKEVKRISDLSEKMIDKILERKSQAQKHQKHGFLTQRQLIAYLKNPINTDRLVAAGIPSNKVKALQDNSESTLKNKIRKLEEDRKIIFDISESAHSYREDKIFEIAASIADILKEKKAK